jgi:hypothetical protein
LVVCGGVLDGKPKIQLRFLSLPRDATALLSAHH